MLGRRMRRVVDPSSVPLLLLFALWSCSSPGRVSSTDSWPACPGLRSPVILGESTSLSFCDMVTGVSCCDADEDEARRKQFEAMNVVPDAECTTVVKGILCASCIPSSSPLPFNTPPAGSTTATESIPPRCAATTSSSLSQQDDGDATMCVERIGAGSYLDMAAHPDGSGRAFLSTQDGKIWLATIPEPGSGESLQIHDEASHPFLDLTDRVLGLMGVAFHPEFAANRRFFVSYTCDTTTSPACVSSAGTAAGNGSTPSSRYQLVVAEFSAKSKATRADPTEVRRIFTMDLPTSSHAYQRQQQNGGQILFRPSDGYLYLMTGHEGDQEANHGEFSSNTTTTSFLGKIVRFNIDGNINGQSGGGASNRTASTTTTAAEEPEIFAVGLGNPRGCSFDSARPSYLFCASVDEQQYESVHLIGAPSAKAAVLVVGYGWRSVSGTPSIVGGRVYRGSADPSLEGSYLYMYGSSAWTAVEAPASSGRYVSAQIPNIMCSDSSPAPCTGGGVHGRVVSFGEDNSNDAFVLATGGVYRVVAPSFCRAGRSRSSAASALPWLLSVGACALASAFYVCWKVFAGGQRPVMNCNGSLFIRCFACIVCPCCNCCNNNVMNIHHGPGAGSEAGLQLGA